MLSVETRTAYPLISEQLVRGEVQASAPKAIKTKSPKPGRPKGSANKNRKAVELSPFQTQLQGCIRAALALIGRDLDLAYFVYDGALGNNAGLQTVRQTRLHLISKLRHDSKLYFPYASQYQGKGKPRKYGGQLTMDTLTDGHLKSEAVEKGIRTRVYQVQAILSLMKAGDVLHHDAAGSLSLFTQAWEHIGVEPVAEQAHGQ